MKREHGQWGTAETAGLPRRPERAAAVMSIVSGAAAGAVVGFFTRPRRSARSSAARSAPWPVR